MTSIKKKAEHVKKAKQTRKHTCHWPGCKIQVPPAKWGCRQHWFMLPKRLRAKVWAAYQIKQEETMTPSPQYLEVAREVQKWIEENCSNGN